MWFRYSFWPLKSINQSNKQQTNKQNQTKKSNQTKETGANLPIHRYPAGSSGPNSPWPHECNGGSLANAYVY